MITFITDIQGNEPEILAPVAGEPLEVRCLVGEILFSAPAPAGGWTNEKLLQVGESIAHLTGDGADAYIASVWVGSTEV